jgi:hypothetical protein
MASGVTRTRGAQVMWGARTVDARQSIFRSGSGLPRRKRGNCRLYRQEQHARADRRFHEIGVSAVKRHGFIIDRVNQDTAYPNDIGRRDDALEGVSQQMSTEAGGAIPVIASQPGNECHRDLLGLTVLLHLFGQMPALNTATGNSVITDDSVPFTDNIGADVSPLTCPGMIAQPIVHDLVAAVEPADVMMRFKMCRRR